jgi:hypothetical protein
MAAASDEVPADLVVANDEEVSPFAVVRRIPDLQAAALIAC